MQQVAPAPSDAMARQGRSSLPAGAALPLSQGQLGIWYAQQLDPSDPAFNLGEYVEFQGAIDPVLLESALRLAVAETGAFSTRIFDSFDGPRQRFEYKPDWPLPIVDFATAAKPVEAARDWMRDDMRRAFALEQERPFRFALLQIGSDRYLWYAVVHHVVIDVMGWRLFQARVAELFNAFAAGQPPTPRYNEQYAASISAEHSYRGTDAWRRDGEFWSGNLRDLPPQISLSSKPPAKPSGIVNSRSWIPATADLGRTSRVLGVSAPALLTAAAAIYLHHWRGADDLVLGIPVNARSGPEMRTAIGLAVNTLPLRIKIDPALTTSDLFRGVAAGMRLILKHRRYRSEQIRADLKLGPRDPAVAATIVNFAPIDTTIQFAGTPIRCIPLTNGRLEDLEILFLGGTDPQGMRLDFTGNRARYSQMELDAHTTRFVALLGRIAEASANGSIATLRIDELCRSLPRGAAVAAVEPPAPAAIAATIPADAGPPATPTETVVAEIWRDVLRSAQPRRHDDFFDLGGDSLLANIVVNRIRNHFSLDVELSTIFMHPTLQALSRAVDAKANDCGTPDTEHSAEREIARASDSAPAPLSFSQHRMWLIQSLDAQNSAYNIAVGLRLTGTLDRQALRSALDAITRRHEILCTTYESTDAGIVQRTRDDAVPKLEVVDLAEAGTAAPEDVMRRAEAFAARAFDLSHGPVCRYALLRSALEEHFLLISLHHIAGDQWSLGIMARELSAYYNAFRNGTTLELPPVALRYRDFAAWQQSTRNDPALSSELAFWRDKLAGVPALELPTDHTRPRLQSLKGAMLRADIPPLLLEQVEQLGRRQSATLFMTMFAGFTALLSRLSSQADIAVGVPVANRRDTSVEHVVGTFVNTLVLRTDLSGDPSISELICRVRDTALEAFAHQNVPFDASFRKSRASATRAARR